MFSGVVRTAVKEFSCKTGIWSDIFFDRYPYCFAPTQLMFLTNCLLQCRDVAGCIVEAGAYQGATTIFLNHFMAESGMNKRYIAVDTFKGFLPDHVKHEVQVRSKRNQVRKIFSDNKKRWFDQSILLSNVKNVESYEADIGKFDFEAIAPIAFCLLDVDFYIPTLEALPKIYDATSPNGIIVVDDCKPGGDWDGALQGYQEFCSARGIKETIAYEKLGIIKKCA